MLSNFGKIETISIVELLSAVLSSVTHLDLRETLISVKLAVDNPINNKDAVIYNLVVYGVNPDEISPNVKEYLINLIR
jgi:hypothetical protein